MSNIPLYKRMQGEPKKTADELLAEADALTDVYREYGIVDCPHRTTDDDIRQHIQEINNSGASWDDRLSAFDVLYFYTVNSHEFGMAADVVSEVLDAKNVVLEEIPYWAR